MIDEQKKVCVLSNPYFSLLAEHHEDPHRDHSHVPAVPYWEGMSEIAEITNFGSHVVSALQIAPGPMGSGAEGKLLFTQPLYHLFSPQVIHQT